MFMGGILFFVKLSLFIGITNYIQYAVFMSSRAYLSSAVNPAEQSDNAKKVLTKTVKTNSGRDRFAGLIRGVNSGSGGGNMTGVVIGKGEIYQDSSVSLSWQQGVRYTFKGSLGLGTLQGENSGGPSNATDIQLSAESWLDRSPTESECNSNMQGAYFDNGC